MNRILVFTSILMSTVMYVDTRRQHKCGKNEIWADCKGCELKCGESEFTPCFLICNPAGCYCPPGFRRNAKKECVAVSECWRMSNKTESKFS
ncbi:Trypsin Inhibitor like cysteine rich domain family protein [Acanthocheilonema viteae]